MSHVSVTPGGGASGKTQRKHAVCPGTIDTPLVDFAVKDFADKKGMSEEDLFKILQTEQPMPRMGTAEEVAHVIAFMSKIPFMVGA